MPNIQSLYLNEILCPKQYPIILKALSGKIVRLHSSAEAIVGCGMSGALVVAYLAHLTDKYPIIVRKIGIASHSKKRVEGMRAKSYIFVDDIVESKTTVRYVLKHMKNFSHSSVCMAIYVYSKAHHSQIEDVDGIPVIHAMS